MAYNPLEPYATRKSKANAQEVFLRRMSAGPIDVSEVFDSESALDTYLASATSYAGQIVAVVNNNDFSVKIYKIKFTSDGSALAKEEVGAAGDISAVTVVKWAASEGGDDDFYESTDTEHTTPLSPYGVSEAGVYIKVVSSESITYSLIRIDLSNYYTKGETDAKFVVQEEGKGLSTNDYSDEDKAKLEEVAEGATKTAGSTENGYILVDDASVLVYEHPSYDEADSAAIKVGRDAEGHVVLGDALTAADIEYADGQSVADAIGIIDEEIDAINDPSAGILAQAKSYTDEVISSSEGPIAKLDASVQALDASLQALDASVESIDASVQTLDSSVQGIEADIEVIDASISSIETALEGKVDASEGARLMTDEEGEKLAGIEAAAQVNVIEGIAVDGSAVVIDENKIAQIVLPEAAEYEIVKVADTSTAYASQYYLSKDGVQAGAMINIPKDQFLKEVKYFVSAAKAESEGYYDYPDGMEFPAIRFEFETTAGTDVAWISVHDLVDTYEGDGSTITISGNVISAIMDTEGGVASYAALQEEIGNRASEDASVLSKAEAYADEKFADASAAVDELAVRVTNAETAIDAIEAKPAYDITTVQITNWENEVGAKAIAVDASAKIAEILDGSGVVLSINNHSGLVTLRGTQDASGSVNLTITNGGEIRADIVGLGDAAFMDPEDIVAITHTHSIGDVTGLEDALAAKLDASTTLAGLDLKDNIDASTLVSALGIEDGANRTTYAYTASTETLTFGGMADVSGE